MQNWSNFQHIWVNNCTSEAWKLNPMFDKSNVKFDNSNVMFDNSNVMFDNSNVKLDKSNVKFDKSNVKFDNSNVMFDKSNVMFDNSNVMFDNSNVMFDNSNVKFDNVNVNINSCFVNEYCYVCMYKIPYTLYLIPIMAARTLRIKIPRNPANLIVLAKLILAKHAADGASSVLSGVDMAGFAGKSAIADTEHERMGQLR